MPTAEQAIRAAVLCQFLTRVGLPITVFRYYRVRSVIYIEAAGGNEIRILIDEQGEMINA